MKQRAQIAELKEFMNKPVDDKVANSTSIKDDFFAQLQQLKKNNREFEQ